MKRFFALLCAFVLVLGLVPVARAGTAVTVTVGETKYVAGSGTVTNGDDTKVTAQVVPAIQRGTSAAFDGEIVPVESALWTATAGQEQGEYTLSRNIDGTVVNIHPRNAANQHPLSSTGTVEVVKNAKVAGTFAIVGETNQALYFWGPGTNTKVNSTHVWDKGTATASEAVNLQNVGYTFYFLEEGEEASPILPGYKKATAIRDGGQYLVVSANAANGAYYCLYPVIHDDANGNFAMTGKLLPSALKLTGVAVTSEAVTVSAGTSYDVTVAAKPAAQTASNINATLLIDREGNACNTWVFTGGRSVQGSYKDVAGLRGMTGHFEEYVRWTVKDVNGVKHMGRMRFVTSTAYEGQTLHDIVTSFDSRITPLHPRATVYMIGPEDLTEDGVDDFKTDLKAFVDKALTTRTGGGYAVVMAPYSTGADTLAQSYADAAFEVLHDGDNFTAAQRQRILWVDTLTGTQAVDNWTANCLHEDGGVKYLNHLGHVEVTRELLVKAFGENRAVSATIDVPANFPNAYTPVTGTNNALTLFGNGVTLATPANSDALTPAQKALRTKLQEESLTWMFMGDSITHGAVFADGFDTVSQSFEKFLKDDLNRKKDIVVNTAVSSATASELGDGSNYENSIITWLDERLGSYSPDVVSIMIGTNDAATNVAGSISTADYKKAMRTILDTILEKGAVPILRTPLPSSNANRVGRLYWYSNALRELCEEPAYRDKIIVVDHYNQWASFTTRDAKASAATTFLYSFLYNTDSSNLHPNPEGHMWFTHQFIDEIGLWKEDSAICRLNYQHPFTFTTGESDLDVSAALTSDGSAVTLDVDRLNNLVKAANANQTVLAADLSDGTDSSLLGYRGRNPVLSDKSGSVSVTVTALIDVNGASGKKVTFSPVTVNLDEPTELPNIPGYTLRTAVPAGGFDPYTYYILAARDENGDYYAFDPNAKEGDDPVSASINGALLDVTGAAVSAEKDMKYLRFTVVPRANGYTVRRLGGDYLELVDKFFVAGPAYVALIPNTDGSFNITNLHRTEHKYLNFTSEHKFAVSSAPSENPIYLFELHAEAQLEAVLNLVSIAPPDTYTAASWAPVAAAAQAGQAVADDPNATSQQRSEAVDALREALNGLVNGPAHLTASAETGFFPDESGAILSGETYAIYGTASDGDRVLHNSGSASNQCMATWKSNGSLDMSTHPAEHTWVIAESGSGYTIAVSAGGKYLTSAAAPTSNGKTQRVISATPEVWTITSATGGWHIRNAAGKYLFFDAGGYWNVRDNPFVIRLFREQTVWPRMVADRDELIPEAPDTQGQPFPIGAGGSDHFRIPAMITLKHQKDEKLNGRVLAATDARWNHSADGFNLDTIGAWSDDGGATWKHNFPNYFGDAVPGNYANSTVFIDPALAEGNDGTVYLLADLFPTNTATWNQGGIIMPEKSTCYALIDGKQRMTVYTSFDHAIQTEDNWTYYVGDFDEDGYAPVYERNPNTASAAGTKSWYYVDRYYYLYRTAAAARNPAKDAIFGAQTGGENVWVQQNLFFRSSELHARAGEFLWLISSTDGGETWSAPTVLNPDVRNNQENALLGGPGAGICLSDGTLMFPTYTFSGSQNGQRSTVIWSTDKGATWHRANNATGTSGPWSSEAAVVELDENTVRMFYRSGENTLHYVDYKRQGTEWVSTQSVVDTGASKRSASGCQLSATVLPAAVDGKDVILVSTPSNNGARHDGKVYVFVVNDNEAKTLSLINAKALPNLIEGDTNNGYQYSTIAAFAHDAGEAKAGDVALLWEFAGNNQEHYELIPRGDLVPTVTAEDVILEDGQSASVTVTVTGLSQSAYTVEYALDDGDWSATNPVITSGEHTVHYRVKIGSVYTGFEGEAVVAPYNTKLTGGQWENGTVSCTLTCSHALPQGGAVVCAFYSDAGCKHLITTESGSIESGWRGYTRRAFDAPQNAVAAKVFFVENGSLSPRCTALTVTPETE